MGGVEKIGLKEHDSMSITPLHSKLWMFTSITITVGLII